MLNLVQRIARLEALEAIRQLKHRYLNACDLKEVETIRDCFASGPVLIDYEAVGLFEDRDSFVDLYASLACQPQVRDSHHGANPEIELLDEERAHGRWALGAGLFQPGRRDRRNAPPGRGVRRCIPAH